MSIFTHVLLYPTVTPAKLRGGHTMKNMNPVMRMATLKIISVFMMPAHFRAIFFTMIPPTIVPPAPPGITTIPAEGLGLVQDIF